MVDAKFTTLRLWGERPPEGVPAGGNQQRGFLPGVQGPTISLQRGSRPPPGTRATTGIPAGSRLPGFDLFRVPARWLLLTSFGLAALAAIGTDYATNLAQTRWYPAAGRALATTGAVGASAALTSWGLGWSSDLQLAAWLAGGSVAFLVLRYCAYGGLPGSIVLPGFLIVELILAQHTLDVNNLAAPPRAYLEPGPVAERLERGPGAPRVLSVADTFYQVEARRFYREGHLEFGHYGAVVLEAYASTVKYRDSLSPNQSSALRIPSPDGYGGGLLPLRRYVAFRDLQLPARPGAEDFAARHPRCGTR